MFELSEHLPKFLISCTVKCVIRSLLMSTQPCSQLTLKFFCTQMTGSYFTNVQYRPSISTQQSSVPILKLQFNLVRFGASVSVN